MVSTEGGNFYEDAIEKLVIRHDKCLNIGETYNENILRSRLYIKLLQQMYGLITSK